MTTIIEPFSKDTDFFTEFGNNGIDANFRWRQGRLELKKLTEGWDQAGLVQTEQMILNTLTTFTLEFTPVTNTIRSYGYPSISLLNLVAKNSPLPGTPALTTDSYGFLISGGKVQVQNGQNGSVYDGGSLTAGEKYTVVHAIGFDGKMGVFCFGVNQPGFLATIDADFRSYYSRMVIQPYSMDTLYLHDLKVSYL